MLQVWRRRAIALLFLPRLPTLRKQESKKERKQMTANVELPTVVLNRLLERNTHKSLNNILASLRRLVSIGVKANIMSVTEEYKKDAPFHIPLFALPAVASSMTEALAASRENSQKTMIGHLLATLRCFGYDESAIGFRVYANMFNRLGRSYYAPSRKDEEYAEQLPGKWSQVEQLYDSAKTNALENPTHFTIQRAHVLMALVVLLPARQSEYLSTRVRRFDKIDDKLGSGSAEFTAALWVENNPVESPNVLCLTNSLWVRSQHKTQGRYGTVVVPVPPELTRIVEQFCKQFDTDVLLPQTKNYKVPISSSQFTALINFTLGTSNCSTQMLRKMRTSDSIDNDDDAETRTAMAMSNGHSLGVQAQIYGRLSQKLWPVKLERQRAVTFSTPTAGVEEEEEKSSTDLPCNVVGPSDPEHPEAVAQRSGEQPDD